MKKNGILLIVLLTSTMAFSQMNPVKWSFAATKISEQEFTVTFTADVDEDWYVYSQFIGEDGPIPTSFNFSENNELELIGTVTEEGDIKKEGYDELFDMDVVKYGGKVIFTQKVKKSKDPNKISGYLEYMTCDETRCLPPAEIDFSIDLK